VVKTAPFFLSLAFSTGDAPLLKSSLATGTFGNLLSLEYLTDARTQTMPTPRDIEEKFWESLKSDQTIMLGLSGVDEGHGRPMAAQFEHGKRSIWFFGSKDSDLVRAIGAKSRATASFVSKGHDLFATIHGALCVDDDRGMIDRLWNQGVAAWYKGGKEDPNLTLLRLDAERAEIWLDGSTLIAGVRMLFGADPKTIYEENVAEVDLT
jgi:general stress protein 26